MPSSSVREWAATSYPLDEQLGLGQAGRMSRYLQEQCGWLLAVLPARMAQQTLGRFGWPAVAASQIREHGEALGAELEQQVQERLTCARQEAAADPSKQTPVRQVPKGARLCAAPDGVMYSTTERDPQTGKARWREREGGGDLGRHGSRRLGNTAGPASRTGRTTGPRARAEPAGALAA